MESISRVRIVGLAMLLTAIHPVWTQTAQPDETVDDLYSQALAAKRKGDISVAIEKYRAILKLQPKLGPAYNNLGLLYLQTSNYAMAVRAFEEGLRADPKMTTALVPLGTAYFQTGQFAKCRMVLERALQVNPGDENAQLYLSRALISLGEGEAAAEQLQKLLRKAPGNVEALYTLGQLYMKLAQGTLKRLENRAPDSYLTDLISGQLLESMENYDGALAQYKKAFEKEPRFKGAHYNIGNIYWLEGKWSETIAEMKEETRGDPFNCLAHWKIGNSLLNMKQDSDEAMRAVMRSLEICPDLAQAHLDLGRLLAGKGEYLQAVERYRKVVELSPEEASTHFLLATAYRKLGRTAEANAEARIVQEMSSKASRVKESRE